MPDVDRSSPQEQVGWTVLAHLLRPQGRKGELLADLFTDFPQHFTQRERVFLASPGFAGSADGLRSITIVSHWLPVGRNQGRVVLGIEGIDSISKAEEIAGLEVIVPESDRVELEDDAEYISDLLGCQVFDEDRLIGTVDGVDYPTTADGSRRLEGAAPLLTVVTELGDDVLIPYVQAFLVSLSTEDKRIEMKLPAGLLDLNRTELHDDTPQTDDTEE